MTFEEILKEMSAVHEAKNLDYGASYELSAQLLGQPVVVGLLHRMADKLARACNLVWGNEARVNESLRDSLLDLANYAVLGVEAIDQAAGDDRKLQLNSKLLVDKGEANRQPGG